MQNKKWISMLLAIVVAFGLWVYVVTIENPEGEITLNNIPVTFTGEDLLREDYGLLVTETNVAGGVDLIFSGKLSDLNRLQDNRSEIEITIDITRLRNAQEYSLSFDISDIMLPSSVSVQDISLEGKEPSKAGLTLEKLLSVPVQVKVQNDVTPDEGYLLGRLTQNYSEIIVEGPEDVVNQINYAQVILSRENVGQSITATLPYTFIDYNGEMINAEGLSCDVAEIEVTLPVLMYKDVPLEAPLIDGGGATAKDAVLDIVPKTVRLSGDPSVLESVQSIKLSNIDLSSMMSNSETVTRTIVIPEGCTSLSGETEAEVKIQIKNKAIRQFRISSSNFQPTGLPSDLSVKFSTLVLNVMIRANEKDIELITDENIMVVVDFSALTLETVNSTMEVPVKIYVNGFDDAGAIAEEDYSVYVDVVAVSETEE